MHAIRRLVCIWRVEETPDTPATPAENQQTDQPEHDDRFAGPYVPGLVCIHNLDPALCVICSRNWAEPRTGQLPYRSKAA